MSIFDEIKSQYDVIIMSGIPGSGKSHIAKKYFGDRKYCSADDHFVDRDGKYNFVPSEIGEAHQACMRGFIATFVGGKANLIVDNTCIEAWEISPYIAIAEAYGVKVCVLQVNCPEDVAAARNTHGVPARTINHMANRLANRRLPPFWKVITVEN